MYEMPVTVFTGWFWGWETTHCIGFFRLAFGTGHCIDYFNPSLHGKYWRVPSVKEKDPPTLTSLTFITRAPKIVLSKDWHLTSKYR